MTLFVNYRLRFSTVRTFPGVNLTKKIQKRRQQAHGDMKNAEKAKLK